MIYGDLHSHTTWSDGTVSPGHRVIAAMRTGNTLMAITDHDTMRGSLAGRKFAQEFNLPITIPTGIEFSTERGHVLVYGLTENPYEGRRGTPFTAVRDLATAQKALLVLAHPNWKPNRVSWESGKLHAQRVDGDFDAFEIINTVEDYRELIAYYDEQGPFPITCGSDCHHADHRADATLWVPCDAGDEAGCLAAIRAGNAAVYASPELKGRNEPPFGQERWLGNPEVIAAAQNLQRQPCRNDAGVEIRFDQEAVFPGEPLTLHLSSQRATTVHLRVPAAGIDESIDLQPGEPVREYAIQVTDELCDDYVYAVVQHDGGWELADCYVARSVQARLTSTGLRLVNEGPFPARDERLETALAPKATCTLHTETETARRIHMPRFKSWDAMNSPEPIELETGDQANHAWAWDEERCYCQITVEKALHCQPYENRGLWEGDCVRLGVLPGIANPPCPPWEKINRQRDPVPTPMDGALTPEGVKLAVHWKQFDGEYSGNSLTITRSATHTVYRFAIGWNVFRMECPQPGDVVFCNGQLHLHDSTRYLGFAPFSPGQDLTSPARQWLWAIVEEAS